MRLALLFFGTLLPFVQLYAQQDSLGALRVYRSLLQEQTLPALAVDYGKHVVQLNTVYHVNAIRTVEQPFQSLQLSYRTRWRKHGLGLLYEGIPGSTIWSNTLGIQYGYGIRFNKHWLRNTQLSLGAGVHLTKVNSDFSRMTFLDQIDNQKGFIRPSGEVPSNNSIVYQRYEAGLLLRSSKLFLGVTIDNLNEPTTGFYLSSLSKQSLKLILNTGIKVVEWKKFSSWVSYEQFNINQQYFLKLAVTLAYNNRFLLTCYQTHFDGPHFRLAYTNNHIRTFLQYQRFENDFTGYLGYGNVYWGMAYAIGKQ